uniref:Cilia and flagella associated protein 100 n=1 Tax=Mus musculus TaxID=10090 RepID=A0A0N4SUU7_MOUSE
MAFKARSSRFSVKMVEDRQVLHSPNLLESLPPTSPRTPQ